jgi:hypothetical protein
VRTFRQSPATASRRGLSDADILRHTDEGERFDDFAIRQQWWTGDALPEAKVVSRELAGVPKIEVVSLSKEKVEEMFWDAVTQARADLARVQRNNFRCLVRRMERNEHNSSTLPLVSVMMTVWIDSPWNGSATTS